MIIVRKIRNGFRCDMCFAKPEYEICGDDRYAELPAFTLHLCKGHAVQLAKSIVAGLLHEKNEREEKKMADMTQEREAKILQDAVDTYGTDSQIGVSIEEMSELTHALSRYQRAKREGKLDELHVRDILLEMADVQIMLNQLRLIFGDDVEEEIFKLERLERRLALPR